jgi:hypothetical protein
MVCGAPISRAWHVSICFWSLLEWHERNIKTLLQADGGLPQNLGLFTNLQK